MMTYEHVNSNGYISASIVGAATCVLLLACNDAVPGARVADLVPTCYASPDGQLIHSTLLVSPASGGEHLIGVTDVRTRGSGEQRTANVDDIADENNERVIRDTENAELDESGRLLHLDAAIGPVNRDSAVRVVLEPAKGRVEIITPSLHAVWSVPSDSPWIWVPMLMVPDGLGPIATPLVGLVMLRAANRGRPVRRLDLATLTSHLITADQLVVFEGQGATVIVGDDAVDVEHGMPTTLHLAALNATLELVDAKTIAQAKAVNALARCPSVR
jgi:hypothetical protein